jgi:hypothetical protein
MVGTTTSFDFQQENMAPTNSNLVLAKNLAQKYSIPFALQDVCVGIQF